MLRSLKHFITHRPAGLLSGLPLMLGLLLPAATAQAAVDVTFGLSSYDVGGSQYASSATSGSYNYTGSDGSTTVTISGWAANDGGGGLYNQNGSLYHWEGGLGLYRGGPWWNEDDHEIDNSGPDEFLVFQFSEPVSLANYSFGWVDTDADSTVLAYGNDSNSLTNSQLGLTSGDSIGDLVSNGWNAIGHYNGGNYAPQTIDPSANTGNVFSSYWIVGAYLSDITPTLAFGSNRKDAFKLASLGITLQPRDNPPGVPVPATLTLTLAGLFLLRRRLRLPARL